MIMTPCTPIFQSAHNLDSWRMQHGQNMINCKQSLMHMTGGHTRHNFLCCLMLHLKKSTRQALPVVGINHLVLSFETSVHLAFHNNYNFKKLRYTLHTELYLSVEQ